MDVVRETRSAHLSVCTPLWGVRKDEGSASATKGGDGAACATK